MQQKKGIVRNNIADLGTQQIVPQKQLHGSDQPFPKQDIIRA